MLDYATRELQPNINKPKRHYRYLFTLNGKPVNTLREINQNMRALIVSDEK